MTTKKKETISDSLERLGGIVQWLDEQERVDVEEGLKKVREGAVLVKELRARLKEVENEFEEVKKELDA
ncbi:MAG: exodeoxyribonuclease VII small subunit [Candidatus Yanofskybacteria bacterium]|nr:exodeoxyribonuclease VII small subunit [Candidatus Yanofskybacteria bacterium]